MNARFCFVLHSSYCEFFLVGYKNWRSRWQEERRKMILWPRKDEGRENCLLMRESRNLQVIAQDFMINVLFCMLTLVCIVHLMYICKTFFPYKIQRPLPIWMMILSCCRFMMKLRMKSEIKIQKSGKQKQRYKRYLLYYLFRALQMSFFR